MRNVEAPSTTVERVGCKVKSLRITDTEIDRQVRLSRPFPRLSHHGLASIYAYDTSSCSDPAGQGSRIVGRTAPDIQQMVAFLNV